MIIKKHLSFLIAFSILQILFFILQAGQKNFYLDDSYEYLKVSDNFIEEGVFYCGDLSQPEDISLYTKRPPGYPLFLSMSRVFTKSLLPVIILQAFLSLLSALLLLRIFDKEGSLSLYFIVFVIFLPAQFIYANLIMAETIFQLILMLAGWMFFSYLESKRLKFVWVYQILLCIGIIIKPVLYLFVIVNLLFFIYLSFRHKKHLLFISSLIPIVFVVAFSSMNKQKTGVYSVSSIQQVNLIDVNLFYFLMQDKGYDYARETTDSIYHLCDNLSYKEYSECLNEEAKKILFKQLPAYGIFHTKGILRFFIDPGRFDIYNFFGLQEKGEKGLRYHLFNGGIKEVWNYLKGQKVLILLWIMLIAMVNVLKTIGFAFFLFNKNYHQEFRIFLFLLIGTIAFATGPLGASRFALPLALFILGGAAIQYKYWYHRFVRKR